MVKSLRKFLELFSSIAWCLSLSWKASKFYTAIRIIMGILLPMLAIGASYVGKYVIDLLAGQIDFDDAYKILVILLLGLLTISIIRMVIQKAMQYCQVMHEDVMAGNVSLMMMEHSLSVDLEYFDNPAYHDKLMSANMDSSAIMQIVWNTISGISSAISFLGVFLVLCRMSIIYGIIMMVAAIPSSIVAARYTKLLYRLSLEQIHGQRQMNYCQGVATDRNYAQDLRLFHAGEKLKERYRRIWRDLFVTRRDVTRRRTLLTGILECLPEAVVGLIGIDIALRVLAGNATVGDYSLYTGLMGQLWGAISILSYSIMNIYDNQMKIDNFKSIEMFSNHVMDDGNALLKQVHTIEFDHVSFAYPGAKELVLDDVNICLRKEEKVALVGLNGSGKSTLIKLLLRMYDPVSGVIRINGLDIREYRLSLLRSNFSVYFQDMCNYSFTLRENFSIANSRSSDSPEDIDRRAIAAMTAANCGDILDRCARGMDTSVTRLFAPDGIECSGGQYQKLALARALFRSHSVLVLDEPSANLDPKAEHEIFESLKLLTDGKMTIFTSHRLSTVFLADRIIVMEHGCVVEDGNHEELLRNNERYAELFKYQQDKFSTI
jgi:ATP-binding cassette subfamily B protein